MSSQNTVSTLRLGDYLQVIRRQWLVIAIGLVLGLGLALAYLHVAPREYRSTTAVLVTPNPARTSTAGINLERSGRRLLGTVTSDATAHVAVTAVCYDTAGRIIGGGSADVGSLTPGAASTFSIDGMTVAAVPQRCAIYTAVS